MKSNRRLTLPFAALLASAALVLASLAPTLSQWLSRDLAWVQVCTALGARQVALASAGDPAAPDPAPLHLGDHCPYCSLHTDLLEPPDIVLRLQPLDAAGVLRLPGARPAPVRVVHWAAPPSRAPPVFS